MLSGFQQLATKIPFVTNYPRVISIQQELLIGEAGWSNGNYPNAPNRNFNAVKTHS